MTQHFHEMDLHLRCHQDDSGVLDYNPDNCSSCLANRLIDKMASPDSKVRADALIQLEKLDKASEKDKS